MLITGFSYDLKNQKMRRNEEAWEPCISKSRLRFGSTFFVSHEKKIITPKENFYLEYQFKRLYNLFSVTEN